MNHNTVVRLARVKKLISEYNKIAINEILEFTKLLQVEELHNEIILLAGRLNTLEKEIRLGILSFDEINRERNRIWLSVMESYKKISDAIEAYTIDTHNDFSEIIQAYSNKKNIAIEAYSKFKKTTGKRVKRYEGYIDQIRKSKYNLAVLGKVKAGKSTFINALIGGNLLPTDTLQNTSSIIEITNSEKSKLSFRNTNDNSLVVVEETADIIEQKLIEIGSLLGKDKYRKLPLRRINNYLAEIGGYTSQKQFNELLDIVSNSLGELDSNTENLVKEYLEVKEVERVFPDRIFLELPLRKEFADIRILDTPGINAIGDLSELTYSCLEEADAKILVHSITDVEENSFVSFANNLLNELPKKIGKQIVLVFTKSGLLDDVKSTNRLIKKAREVFGGRIGNDRIIWVDSIFKILYDDLSGVKDVNELIKMYNEERINIEYIVDLGNPLLEGKREFITAKIKALKKLMQSDDPNDFFSTSTNIDFLRAKAISLSNFDILEIKLAHFLTSDPTRALDQFITYLRKDYGNLIRENQKSIDLLDIENPALLKKKLEVAKIDLEKSKLNLEKAKRKVEREITGANAPWKNVARWKVKNELSDILNDLKSGKKKKKVYRRKLSHVNSKITQVLREVYESNYQLILDVFNDVDLTGNIIKRNIPKDKRLSINVEYLLDRAKKKSTSHDIGSYKVNKRVSHGRHSLNFNFNDYHGNLYRFDGYVDLWEDVPEDRYYSWKDFDKKKFAKTVEKSLRKAFDDMENVIVGCILELSKAYSTDLFEQLGTILDTRKQSLISIELAIDDNTKLIHEKKTVSEHNLVLKEALSHLNQRIIE